MITGINEPKRLPKHISCECKCKFGVSVKNIYLKKNMFGILLRIIVKMENI